MAGFDYGRMARTAQRLGRRFGQSAQIVSRVAGSGPAWNPGQSSSETRRPCVVVETQYSQRDVDGTLVRQGDYAALVPALSCGSVPPSQGDRLEYAGKVGEVVAVKPTAPGGKDLIYEVQLRGV